MTAAGAAVGLAFAAAGAGIAALWPDGTLALAVGLGAIAFVYAVHESGLIRLPVPGRDWQVPADWVRDGFYRSAVIFGGTLGFGVFTRVPFASLPILFAWLFVSGNVLYGIVAGAIFGLARGLSIYIGSSRQSPEDMVALNQRLMAMAPSLHLVTGLALATFATYLIAAPYLP